MVSRFGNSEVLEKFEIERPEQIDYLGMMGDAADNIPGLRAWGKNSKKILS
jgi:DNA polymerase-1